MQKTGEVWPPVHSPYSTGSACCRSHSASGGNVVSGSIGAGGAAGAAVGKAGGVAWLVPGLGWKCTAFSVSCHHSNVEIFHSIGLKSRCLRHHWVIKKPVSLVLHVL